MVTNQKFVTTVCKPGKCVVCDGREAAALGRTKPKSEEDKMAFYKHALDANAVRLRQLIDKGHDDIMGQIRRVFAFGRLAGESVFMEPSDGVVVL